MGEDALGHPPDNESPVMERTPRKLEAARRYYSIPPTRIISKRPERHPEAVGDFVAKNWICVIAKKHYKGTHYYGRQPEYSWAKVIELTNDHSGATDVDSGFFPSLANRRIHQRFVAGFFASARESDLTTPRICLVMSALNEKDFRLSGFLAEPKDQRNCGAADAHFVLLFRRVPRDSFRELRDFGMIAQSLE